MGKTTSAVKADRYSPEWVIYDQLCTAYQDAYGTKSRTLLFLEARYEWTGWEKFQRVVVFDFSGSGKKEKANVGKKDLLAYSPEACSDTLSDESAVALLPRLADELFTREYFALHFPDWPVASEEDYARAKARLLPRISAQVY